MSNFGPRSKPPKYRPFAEFRPKELGLGFSLAADHDTERWIPNVWLQLGPLIVGIEVRYA